MLISHTMEHFVIVLAILAVCLFFLTIGASAVHSGSASDKDAFTSGYSNSKSGLSSTTSAAEKH
jgi:hypothetical protein